ncbi:MAG: hypothetical protein C0621_04545 [Desulfuromonas sp.]|nr:MAG: hypothetical protein C0621_04545 [Desulfuromonas sp.]
MRALYRFTLLTLCLMLFSGCAASKGAKKDAEVHFILGISYLRQGDVTRALKEFLMAEEFDSRDGEIQSSLGQAYLLKDALEKAEEHDLKALRLDPENPRYANNLAALYLEMERWDDALLYFEQAADNLLFANPEVALTGMATAYFHKGDYLQAAKFSRKALAQNARYPLAYLRLGETYFALDRNDKAITNFEQAISLVTAYPLAQYKLALAYMKAEQHEKALLALNEVIRLAPESELAEDARHFVDIIK